MITTILSDFSRLLVFAKDKAYQGSLNSLYLNVKIKADFKLFDFFVLNKELLAYYASLKNIFQVYIFSSSKLLADQEVLSHLKPVFIQIFSAESLGLDKSESNAYEILAKDYLKKNPGEIIFIDDQQENINAAKEVGYKTYLYKDNNKELFSFLNKTLKPLIR